MGWARKKIIFDAALPEAKTATRRARLADSLDKLVQYRALHRSSLPCGPAAATTAAIPHPEAFFLATGPGTGGHAPRVQPLAAPPFIVAAALAWLAAHPAFGPLTETVPGEADPFLAAAAIRHGGIVLTSDSDLFVFTPSGPGAGGGEEWGVVMLRDLAFSAGQDQVTDTASARVFRPANIAAALGAPLVDVAFQLSLDPFSSLPSILARLARPQGFRKRRGAGVRATPPEFVAQYALPAAAGAGAGAAAVEEPRLGELLFLAKTNARPRTMFLPFLAEDPQRAPAWDVCRDIRAAAYSLLFPRAPGAGAGGEGETQAEGDAEGNCVTEVFRRGTRIVDAAVARPAADDLAATLRSLSARIDAAPDDWWAALVLDDVCALMRVRQQPPPARQELAAAAAVLLAAPSPAPPAPSQQPPPPPPPPPQGWTWPRVWLFAALQAGWYSLLLLRAVLAFLAARGGAVAGCEALQLGLQRLPSVLEIFDGPTFAVTCGGGAVAPAAWRLAGAVLARCRSK